MIFCIGLWRLNTFSRREIVYILKKKPGSLVREPGWMRVWSWGVKPLYFLPNCAILFRSFLFGHVLHLMVLSYQSFVLSGLKPIICKSWCTSRDRHVLLRSSESFLVKVFSVELLSSALQRCVVLKTRCSSSDVTSLSFTR